MLKVRPERPLDVVITAYETNEMYAFAAAKMFRENREEFNRRVKQDVEKSLGL